MRGGGVAFYYRNRDARRGHAVSLGGRGGGGHQEDTRSRGPFAVFLNDEAIGPWPSGEVRQVVELGRRLRLLGAAAREHRLRHHRHWSLRMERGIF